MAHTEHIRSLLLALATTALISGCAAGPDFLKPAAPRVVNYTPSRISLETSPDRIPAGGTQALVTGANISGEWWKLFRSKPLNDLIRRSLQANPNLKAAQAALAVARENTLAQYGAYYPAVSGGFSAFRQKTSNQISATPANGAFYYSLYTPQVSVSYTPDVFGLNRRTVESLKAQEEATRYALVATDIALSANVVTAAVQEASLREQISATRRIIAINVQMLHLLGNQFAKGSATGLDVAAEESQLAQVEATLPPMIAQLAQQRDLLSVLAGGFPGDGLNQKFELKDLYLPRRLPLSLPSRLVEQRPDVRQAEESLHSASAQVGVAFANRLPSFTLTSAVGGMALLAGQMFAGDARFWTLAAGVTQPIFEGGTLLHRERAARAAYVQAAEQYKSTVLGAFQNVADTLYALEQDGKSLNAARAAENAAKATLDLTRRQLQAGTVNYLAVLSAEQAYHQAVITLVQAEASRFSDTAALFLALGGGWWNRPEMIDPPHLNVTQEDRQMRKALEE